MANPPIQLSLQTDQSPPSLTPPVTPIAKENRPNPFQTQPTKEKDQPCTTYFTDDLEICRDSNDRQIEFGRGVWSTVYKARSTPTQPFLGTPPSSPVTAAQVFAVKAPLRRDARPVLKAEAATLTRLTHINGHELHIVPYHGFHTELCALVLSAIPLSLATYTEDQAELSRKRTGLKTMFEPVQGSEAFKDLAKKLITGLNWLHDTAGVVHGDIKPQNILLRESHGPFPFEPLFIDFSATVEITSDDEPLDTTRASMSSFTPPFTAPEMLASLMCSEMAPTAASDVFSLAATLLAVATGDLLLYSNMNHRLRLEMARAGHQIIDFTRGGMSGCRVPKNGFVERIVKPAVVKDPKMRIATADWMKLVLEV
ncbi:unnamed protein product [Penicillium salamii]|nr:unnamed protein product [Penicillium salamii]CAG8419389.1 unnamed protein product [Penicillium salamii]